MAADIDTEGYFLNQLTLNCECDIKWSLSKCKSIILIKQEPQGALIAHLSTMSTSVKS